MINWLNVERLKSYLPTLINVYQGVMCWERAYPGRPGERRTGHRPPGPGSWWRRGPSTQWRQRTPGIRCDKMISDLNSAYHPQHPWGLLLRLGRLGYPCEAFLNEATDYGQRLTFWTKYKDCQENCMAACPVSAIWALPCGHWAESLGRCQTGSGWRDSEAICNICKL